MVQGSESNPLNKTRSVCMESGVRQNLECGDKLEHDYVGTGGADPHCQLLWHLEYPALLASTIVTVIFLCFPVARTPSSVNRHDTTPLPAQQSPQQVKPGPQDVDKIGSSRRSMYTYVSNRENGYSSSFVSATSSAGPHRNVSLPRFSFIILLLTGPLPVMSGTAPNTTVTNELGFPLCVPSDEVIYKQCLPSEFEPESDTCPVTTPQEVNYILPRLNQFLPVLVQIQTTEEGGGQIPGACKPGSLLPSTMDNKSVLVLCFVTGVLGPVSPMFLIVCVYLAPAPRRFLLNLIATLRAAKTALLFVSRCLRMVWDTGAMCLHVGVAKTTACLYGIVLFYRFTCWSVSWLVNYHFSVYPVVVPQVHPVLVPQVVVPLVVVAQVALQPQVFRRRHRARVANHFGPQVCLVVLPRLSVEEECADPSFPRNTACIPYKETQKLPDDSHYIHSSYIRIQSEEVGMSEENQEPSSTHLDQAIVQQEDGSYILSSHVNSTIVGEDDVIPPVLPSNQSSDLQDGDMNVAPGQLTFLLLLPTFPLKHPHITASLFRDVDTPHPTNQNSHTNEVATNLLSEHLSTSPGDVRQPRDDALRVTNQNPDESNPNLRHKTPRVMPDEQASLLTKSTRAAPEENPASEGETPVACGCAVIPQLSDSLSHTSDVSGQPRPTEYDPCGDKPVTVSITGAPSAHFTLGLVNNTTCTLLTWV